MFELGVKESNLSIIIIISGQNTHKFIFRPASNYKFYHVMEYA